MNASFPEEHRSLQTRMRLNHEGLAQQARRLADKFLPAQKHPIGLAHSKIKQTVAVLQVISANFMVPAAFSDDLLAARENAK